MSSSRLHVALPAIVTFVFGAAFGLIAGRMAFGPKPGQAHGAGQAAPARAGEAARPAPAVDPAAEEADLRRTLEAHEKLLVASPDDVRLLRSVGNYRALLGKHEDALAAYRRAREVASAAGDTPQVVQVLVDEGVSLAEAGDLGEAFALLREAATLDPKDTRSRLTQVAIYILRVMPQPPPGFDRKEAVATAERLLAEVEAIEPANPHAAEFRGIIDSVRASMGRPREGAAAAPGTSPTAGDASAPAAAAGP